MRYIDYDKVDFPTMGDTYFDKETENFKIWDGTRWITIFMDNNGGLSDRRKELIEEFEKDPELFNDVFNEIRRRKIKKLIK